MKPLSLVTAPALWRRRVRLDDTVLERAWLFPMFDGQGRVRALLLVWPPAGRIVVLEHRPDLVRVRLWRELRIRSTSGALRDAEADLAAYAHLWHYDPNWVLRAACFERHAAVPGLKATNCVGSFLKPVHGCYFARDLSRLEDVSVVSKTTSGLAALDRAWTRFVPELLPKRPEPAQPDREKKSWTLDPSWMRSDWSLRARAGEL